MAYNKQTLLASLIGLGFSITLTFLILRGMLLTTGRIDTGDVNFYYDINFYRKMHVWSDTFSIPYTLYHSIIMFPLSWFAGDVETMGRLVYSLLFILISFIIFLVTFIKTKKKCKKIISCYAACITASAIYTLNPTPLGFVGWFLQLLPYALLPSFFYLIPRAIDEPSRKGTIKYGLISALIMSLNFASAPFGIIMSLVFVSCLTLIIVLLEVKKDPVRYILRGVTLIAILIILPLLISAYAVFPSMLIGRPYTWHPVQLQDLYLPACANIKLYDAFRLWKWSLETVPMEANLLVMALTFIVPLTAWSTAILSILGKTKVLDKKTGLTLSLLSLMFLFLAKGVSEPFGNLYAWMVFNVPYFIFFSRSEFWIQGLSLSYALLCSFLVAEVFEKIKMPTLQTKFILKKGSLGLYEYKHIRIRKYSMSIWNSKTAISIMIILLISTSLQGPDVFFQMLTGDFGRLISPTPLPQAYHDVNNWLSSQSDEFRTLWLPTFGTPTWGSQSIFGFQLVGGHWVSSRPVASSFNPSQRDFMDFSLSHISEGETFEDLLGLYSIKYIIFHNDTFDVEGNKRIYADLLSHGNLRQVYSKDFIYVFRNDRFQPYIRPLGKIVVSLGNLRVLTLNSLIPKFNPSNLAIIFPEQYPILGKRALKILTSDDVLLFYNKNFTDLLFSYLSSDYIYAPVDYLKNNLQDWRVVTPKSLMNYEHDYGKGLVFSPVNDLMFSFEVRAKYSTQHEVWARVFQSSSAGGSFDLYIDNSKVGVISIPTSLQQSFIWIKVGALWLNKGEHKLTIVNKIDGAYIPNINLISVVPSEELRKTQELVLTSLLETNVRVVYVIDGDFFEERTVSYLFQDDFSNYPEGSNGSLTWTPIGKEWMIKNGELIGKSPGGIEIQSVTGSSKWGNYVLEGKMQAISGAAGVFLFRFNDLDNTYAVTLEFKGDFSGKTLLWKRVNGVWTILSQKSINLNYGTWYKFKIIAVGNSFKVYINDVVYHEVSDTDISAGKVGVRVFDGEAHFDDITVREVSRYKTIFTPKDSKYVVALRTLMGPDYGNSTLKVDSQEFVLNFRDDSYGWKWSYTQPVHLSQGFHEITLSPKGKVSIAKVSIYSIAEDKSLITLDEIFKEETFAPVISYKKITPEEWIVEVNTQKPFILAFSETYHEFWSAYTNDSNYEKFPIYSQINGFFINKTGNFTIKLEFTVLRLLKLGLLVSEGTLILVFTSLILLENRIRSRILKIARLCIKKVRSVYGQAQ